MILAVDNFAHSLNKLTVNVIIKQRIPVGSPDDLDHVPASTAEGGFQFLNDLAVASYRPIKSLQVAVNDPGEVVQIFARCQRQSTQGFWLIAFAVTKISPDAGLGRIQQSAMLHVPQEASVINRTDRTESHRHGWELPERRHQPRMRIAGKTNAGWQFTSEVHQLIFADATFQKRARIHPGRCMPLEVNHVAGVICVASMEEVILSHFVKSRRRRERRNVATDAVVILVGSHHHRHRIPADDVLDATFHLPIARELHLIGVVNRVDVRSVRSERKFDSASIRALLETDQQGFQLIFTVSMKNIFQRLVPLIEFFRSNPRNLIMKCLIRHSFPQR